jgi:hypothetical protein
MAVNGVLAEPEASRDVSEREPLDEPAVDLITGFRATSATGHRHAAPPVRARCSARPPGREARNGSLIRCSGALGTMLEGVAEGGPKRENWPDMKRDPVIRWLDRHPWLMAGLVGTLAVLMGGPLRVLTVEGATLENSVPAAFVGGLIVFLLVGLLLGVRPKSSGRHASRDKR